MLASRLARIPDRFSEHRVKLALGEFLGLPHARFPRHHLCRRAGTGSQQRRPWLRHRPYPGFRRWRLVTALQAQASQLGADRVTAIPETARYLRGAPSYGPEFFEPCYVFGIPTHGIYLYTDCGLHASRLPGWAICSRRAFRTHVRHRARSENALRRQRRLHSSARARPVGPTRMRGGLGLIASQVLNGAGNLR
jgi:hypothetical protein